MIENRIGRDGFFPCLTAGCVLLLAGCFAISLPAQQKTPSTPAEANAASHPAQPAGQADRGERIFDQQCSRCHNAPQGFSPRISGTVVRHMRVRDSLSAADEKALLRFLNP